ncbi:Autophagy-Related Protein 16-1 [Manis pentadactyla]|nr:Autophagy-Related Protein 16-1 [Manis pentadactyla]
MSSGIFPNVRITRYLLIQTNSDNHPGVGEVSLPENGARVAPACLENTGTRVMLSEKLGSYCPVLGSLFSFRVSDMTQQGQLLSTALLPAAHLRQSGSSPRSMQIHTSYSRQPEPNKRGKGEGRTGISLLLYSSLKSLSQESDDFLHETHYVSKVKDFI